MKIILVGKCDGKAIVNWPGVLGSASIVAALAMVGAAAFMVTLGWFSPLVLVMAAILIPALVVGMSVQRALQLPIEQLKPLK